MAWNHLGEFWPSKTLGPSCELIKALITITLLQVLGRRWQISVRQLSSTRTETESEISIISLTRVENSPVRGEL